MKIKICFVFIFFFCFLGQKVKAQTLFSLCEEQTGSFENKQIKFFNFFTNEDEYFLIFNEEFELDTLSGVIDYNCPSGEIKYFAQLDNKLVLALQGNLKSGKPDGWFVRYDYLTGEKINEGMFQNGKKEGLHSLFSIHGRINFHYKNGVLHGLHEDFDKEGNLVKKGTYSNGCKNGLWTYYKQNTYFEYQTFQEFYKDCKLIYTTARPVSKKE